MVNSVQSREDMPHRDDKAAAQEAARVFGEHLRDLRLAKQRVNPAFSLRGWAKMIGLSPGYLSAVENGTTPPPAPRHLRLMAALLECDYDDLLAKSGRIADDLTEILIESSPLRKLVYAGVALGDDAREILLEIAHKLRTDPEMILSAYREAEGSEVPPVIRRLTHLAMKDPASIETLEKVADAIEAGEIGFRKVRI